MPCVLRAYLGVVVIVKRCLDGGTKIAGLIVFMAAAVGNNQVFHSARLDLPASASASVLLSVCPSDLSLPFFLSFSLAIRYRPSINVRQGKSRSRASRPIRLPPHLAAKTLFKQQTYQ